MAVPPVDVVDRHRTVEVPTDTCDACGVPAFVYVQLRTGGTLAYCGHHGTEYMPRLVEVALVIIDHRDHIGA